MQTPLWLAISLPLLPLEAHSHLPSPGVVAEQHRLGVCDAAASNAGLRSGMSVAAARALLPSVHLITRDVAREQTALEQLACWAGQFTPHLSIVTAASRDPHALLLDVGSCLSLFGGMDVILLRVREGLCGQGMTIRLAVAPVAQAALWLAQAGSNAICMDRASMQTRLQMLRLDVLPVPVAAKLGSFGMRTLGDVRALPSAALARRIDGATLQSIARAFGDLPDLRLPFIFPQRFFTTLELPAPVDVVDALLFAAHRLIAALAGWLAVRQAGITELTLHLLHRQGSTPVILRFAAATRDAVRIERVLRERLQRLPLPRKTPGRSRFFLAPVGGVSDVASEPGAVLTAPVESLQLEATHVDALPGQTTTLFDSAVGNAAMMGELIERLRARMGETSVFGLKVIADHRPECATHHAAQGEMMQSDCGATRPFWLLSLPQALSEINGRPFYRGPLQLLTRAERIESGWWSGGENLGDVRRDYFVALSADRRWLWIYRECRFPGGWFLQGFF